FITFSFHTVWGVRVIYRESKSRNFHQGDPAMLNLFRSPGGRRSPSSRTPGRKPAARRPEVEPLEGRLVPAKIAVHNFNDGAPTAFSGNVAPNLRSAIDFSHSGDEIDLDTGTYLLSNGELDVAHDLLIKNNAGGVSTIDGQNRSRVF